jgi:RNase P subunit RPR2
MIKNQKLLKEMAQERIGRLLSMAKARTLEQRKSDALSKRYVNIAKNIVSHYKMPKGKQMKAEVCSSCDSVLIPGINCSVRLASSYGYIVYRCRCGAEKHVIYREAASKGFGSGTAFDRGSKVRKC